MELNFGLALGLGLGAIGIAILALFVLSRLQPAGVKGSTSIFTETSSGTVFLFDGETLIDATAGARALLSTGGAKGSAWQRLQAFIAPRFPEFEARIAGLSTLGNLTLASSDAAASPLTLHVEWRGGLARISVIDAAADAQSHSIDTLSLRAMEEELDILRNAITHAPILMWRQNRLAEVVWANQAYLSEVIGSQEEGGSLTWPLPRLFPTLSVPQGESSARGQRGALEQKGGKPHWFDLHAFPQEAGHLIFALPADPAVHAETALREFVQTLTKTFAHLQIGLAIFDRQRQLALFNPALLDLTTLPPDFLSARPTLFSFLDAMRDRHMIPEPKDYKAWRKQMIALEKAAASGKFEEVWTLPSGQTYRVTGRPHPDGAMALMFEDISAETLQTRRYRADLELGQAVIDSMDEGMAIFSQAGTLVMSNRAYASLWGHDPGAMLAESGLGSVCTHWRTKSAPSPIWTEASAFINTLGPREPWAGEARLVDGRLIACRFQPLTGGATLAGFRVINAAQGKPRKLASAKGSISA